MTHSSFDETFKNNSANIKRTLIESKEAIMSSVNTNNITPNFSTVTKFEQKITEFFGAPYAVATDSATHAIELCLLLTKAKKIYVPHRTYLSVPMLANKLGIELQWVNKSWEDYYFLTDKIADAAVLWKRDSYIPLTYMCLSFQYQKHLSLGRGGVILLDSKEDADILRRMTYDGREPGVPWREQDIDIIGYHYYLLPELADLGLSKLQMAINTVPRKWTVNDWPDISQMKVFKK